MDQKKQQEHIRRFSILQQKANQIQEQIQQINSQIEEFEGLKRSVGDVKEGREVLSPLGRGLFFKSDVKDKKLFVSIGSGIVVKRNPEKAGEIIDKQIGNMKDVKKDLVEEIEGINSQFQEILTGLQS
jgi:prefoldin alpha subunit